VAVQDLYSRRIVGWSMADHMRCELVTDALQMALAHRRPDRGLIYHSDQGSHFVSLAFGQQARAAGIAQSMGSKGDCFDNAVAESFFATLKKELIHRRSWPTKTELRTEIFDYIEVFYNRERRHSTLGQLSPLKYEMIHLNQEQAEQCPPKRGRSTLHLIAVCRLRYCDRARSYAERRTREGKSQREIMRCLKRYIAREVHSTLRADLAELDLRPSQPTTTILRGSPGFRLT